MKPVAPTSLDLSERQVIQASRWLKKIVQDPDALNKISAVRDGLYTSDGQVLRAILATAASNQEERNAFIAGLQYEKCKNWFWQCGIPPLSWNKLRFKYLSSLKGHIDALEEKLIQIGALQDSDFSDFDPRLLDPYEPYFQLYTQLEPLLGPLISFLFGHYTEKSIEKLDLLELRELLQKLIAFLDDNEHGALGFIRKASPRS